MGRSSLFDPMDAEFGRRISIDHVHELIHEGRAFFASDVRTTGSAVTYRISVGAKDLHITFDVETSLKVSLAIIEGVTITGAGSAWASYNYNRESSNTIGATFFIGSTYTGGTVFRTNQSGFGTNAGNAKSGTSRATIEYIFRPNTEYILLATPSASADIRVIADFYEGD